MFVYIWQSLKFKFLCNKLGMWAYNYITIQRNVRPFTLALTNDQQTRYFYGSWLHQNSQNWSNKYTLKFKICISFFWVRLFSRNRGIYTTTRSKTMFLGQEYKFCFVSVRPWLKNLTSKHLLKNDKIFSPTNINKFRTLNSFGWCKFNDSKLETFAVTINKTFCFSP